jgi:hypothetical protein
MTHADRGDLDKWPSSATLDGVIAELVLWPR